MNIKTVDKDNLPEGEVLLVDALEVGAVLIYIYTAQRFCHGSFTSKKTLMVRRHGDFEGQELADNTRYIKQKDLVELIALGESK
jgi:hypothetical protein